jgi:hypothetical protein
MDQRLPQRRVSDELLGRMPQHVEHVRAYVAAGLRRPVRVEVDDHRQVLDELLVAGLRPLQHRLDLALGGDVEEHPLPEQGPSGSVVNQERLVADPGHRAVGFEDPVLGVERVPRAERVRPRFSHDPPVALMLGPEPRRRVADEVLRLVAEDLDRVGAHVEAPRIGLVGHDVDDDRKPFHQGPIARLGPRRLGFGGPLRGDVFQEPLPVAHDPVVVTHRRCGLAEPSPPSVPMHEAVLGFEGAAGLDRSQPLGIGRRSLVGMEPAHPEIGPGHELLGCEPRDLVHARGGVQHPRCRLVGEQHDGRR